MRLQITRRTELALAAVQHLAQHGRTKSAALAAAVGSTPAFMARVLHHLVSAGWVRSDPGPTGGYELAASPEDISLLSLIEACEGPTDDGRCVLHDRACAAGGPCALHGVWVKARASLTAELATTSVGSLPPIDPPHVPDSVPESRRDARPSSPTDPHQEVSR